VDIASNTSAVSALVNAFAPATSGTAYTTNPNSAVASTSAVTFSASNGAAITYTPSEQVQQAQARTTGALLGAMNPASGNVIDNLETTAAQYSLVNSGQLALLNKVAGVAQPATDNSAANPVSPLNNPVDPANNG
jgi:hypothetical protein